MDTAAAEQEVCMISGEAAASGVHDVKLLCGRFCEVKARRKDDSDAAASGTRYDRSDLSEGVSRLGTQHTDGTGAAPDTQRFDEGRETRQSARGHTDRRSSQHSAGEALTPISRSSDSNADWLEPFMRVSQHAALTEISPREVTPALMWSGGESVFSNRLARNSRSLSVVSTGSDSCRSASSSRHLV